MKRLSFLLQLPALAAALLTAAPAPASDRPLVVAASDCVAVGMRVAAETGGRLAQARPSDQGGRPVCVIVVLVPGRDGERPRRAEFVVPQE